MIAASQAGSHAAPPSLVFMTLSSDWLVSTGLLAEVVTTLEKEGASHLFSLSNKTSEMLIKLQN